MHKLEVKYKMYKRSAGPEKFVNGFKLRLSFLAQGFFLTTIRKVCFFLSCKQLVNLAIRKSSLYPEKCNYSGVVLVSKAFVPAPSSHMQLTISIQ